MSLSRSPPRPGAAYVVAVLATAVVGAVRWALEDVLGETAPFIPFILPVMLAAWYGGLKPGLLATALSALFLVYFFVPPRYSFRIEALREGVAIAIFLACAVTVSFLCEALHAARRRADGQRRRLEAEIAARTQADAEAEKARRDALANLDRLAERARLLELSHDAIIIRDADDRIVHWNPGAEQIYGWTSDEARGRVTHELLKTEFPEPLPAIQAALHREGHWTGELVHFRRDGAPVSVASRWALNRSAQGRLVSILEVNDDIGARKTAEDALRESETRFRLVANTIPSLAWTAEADGASNWFNDRWYSYTGTTPEQMAGWGWRDVHDPRMYQDVVARWKTSVASGVPFEMEFPLRGADGRFRWFLTRVVPMRDAAGRIVKWFGTNTDIDDLRTAQAELRDAARRKDEFLATLAHELRNPLAPIGNAVQLFKLKGLTDPDLASSLEVIDRQVGHMAHLLDDLLDASRITRGTLPLRKERLALKTVVSNALDVARPGIEAGGHEVEMPSPFPALELDADPVRLTQVFSNLLNNAARYTDAGGRIRIAVERREEEVDVVIADNGIGIEAGMLPRIFEAFAQAAPSMRRAQGGLGIGLSLVRSLVLLHGGSVEARSEGPGRGSEFIVRLPIARETGAAPPPRTGSEAVRIPVGAAPRRILVADDLPDNADSLSMLLRQMGHEVETVYGGEEAVLAAGRCRPDLVLLDLGMPALNGYDACRRIRAQEGGTSIPIIALTGWGQEGDRHRTREVGFDRHLVKPIDITALRSLLATLGADSAGGGAAG